MKMFLSLCAAVILAFSPMAAHAAADFTGTWTGELKSPDGSASFALTFTFKQDGAKVTGTVQGPQGDPIAISDGKADGDTLTFHVSFNGMTISHTGVLASAGDEMKLTTKSDSPDFPGSEMTLKRTKQP